MRSASLAAVKLGLQAGVALLPHSSNVSRHAQRTAARRQINVSEIAESTNAGLQRDCGVESNTRASLISIYENGDCYASTSCNTRATTNGLEKEWNRSRRFELVCLFIFRLGRRASQNAPASRAFVPAQGKNCCNSTVHAARPAIRPQKAPQAALPQRPARLLTLQQQRCNTPYPHNRRARTASPF